MSAPTHLLIAYAAGATPQAQEALRALRLPRLERLLQRLQPLPREPVDDLAPEAPHERALARDLGLDAGAGRTPWAAWALQHAGGSPGTDAWAWITPCHWKAGRDQLLMQDPERLELAPEHARELFAALKDFFAEDGVELHFDSPQRWRARGELFRDLESASLDRVSGREIGVWMPESPSARILHRLQSEVQMLLYTHPVNDAREALGLPAVNSFWVSGAGALPATLPATPAPELDLSLREAALRQDWAAWAQAWQRLDAGRVAEVLAASERGEPVRLTLCGERAWQVFETAPRSLFQKISGLFGTKSASNRLELL